ncbi:periplasmic heavy metal sensor [Albidovulum sp.]
MTEARQTRRGWLPWALVASLALNLLVIGAIAGAAIGHHRGPPREGIRDVGIGPYSEVLSPADRAALREAYRREAPDLRDGRRQAQKDFAALADALQAEPFDLARVEAVISRQTGRLAQRIDLGGRLLVERIATMSPEERRGLAERIQAQLVRR